MGYARGIRWSDDLIEEKVLEVKEALELNRMPSRSECEKYFHNCALTNAVSKRCGWYALAEQLNLPIKDSETYFGKTYEAKAAEMFQSRGLEVRRMAQNFPYDLLVEGCVKVDVKASRLFRGENGSFYTFNLEKPFATCDFFLLLLVDDDGTIARTLVVPSSQVIANNQISVGAKSSKYYKFTDRWDLVTEAAQFWASLGAAVV